MLLIATIRSSRCLKRTTTIAASAITTSKVSSILSATTRFSTISLATRTSSSAAATTSTRRMNNKNLDKDIEDCHLAALKAFETTYIDPHTGFTVFTELLHLQRGKCCGNACRHCPYGWINVVDQSKLQNTGSRQRQQEISVLLGTNSVQESHLAIQHRIQQIKALSQGQAETNSSAISPISTPVVVVAATSPVTTTDSHTQLKKTNMLASSSSRSISTTSTTTPPPTTTKAASTSSKSTATTKSTTGGRKGGRKTTKNVPYTRTGDKGTSQLLTGERRIKSDLVFDAMGTVDELCSITGIVHSMLLMEQQKQQQESHQQQKQEQSQQKQEEENAIKQTTITTVQDSSMENDDDDYDMVDLNEWLLEIMSRLFDIGTHIANPQKRIVRNDDKNSYSETEEEDNDNNDKNDTAAYNGIGGGFDPAHIEVLEDWIDIMTEQLPVLHSFILPTSGAITLVTSHLHQARCVCRRAERSVVQLINNNKNIQQQHSVTATTSTKDSNKGDDHEKECEDIYYYYVYDEHAVQYLNRLSDFYFTAARWVHYDRAATLGIDGEQQEILYQRPFRGAKQRNRTTQKR